MSKRSKARQNDPPKAPGQAPANGNFFKNGSQRAMAMVESVRSHFGPLDPRRPHTVKLVSIVGRGASRAQIPRMAAALSYRTIFGLIPMIVVSLVVLAAFAKPEDVTTSVRQLLRFAGLSEIVVEEKVADPDEDIAKFFEEPPATRVVGGNNDPDDEIAKFFETPRTSESGAGDTSLSGGAKPQDAGQGGEAASTGGTPAPALDANGNPAPVDPTLVAKGTESFTELAGTKEAAKLDKWIEGLVLRVQGIRLDALGAVGFVMLIYAAISMMVEIEKAFNHIYMAPSGRSWTRRVPLYWTMMTLGFICMAGTFFIQEMFVQFVDDRIGRQGFIGSTAALVGVYGITALISTLLLLVMYTTVPNTRVRIGPAAVGAALGAIAWEAAKWGFAEYVRFSAGTAKLYGFMALLPLFLLWIYLTWCIVLMGLEIAHSLQTYGIVRERGVSTAVMASLGLIDERMALRVTGIVDPASILPVMLSIAERFDEGKATDHPAAARMAGVDERVVSEMLERLAGAGLLHRVQGERDDMFSLTRPPEMILASDVLMVGEDLVSIDRTGPAAVLNTVARARVQAFESKTLRDLMPRSNRGSVREAKPQATPVLPTLGGPTLRGGSQSKPTSA